ncbi:hypothetical protein Tco_0002375 [Tanacetum coccineum]
MMTGTEFDIEKFDKKNDFGLWQVRIKALLEQQGLAAGGDTTRSTYLVNRSPLSVIGFKKHRDMLGFFGWLASIKQGMLEPVKWGIQEKDDSNEVAFAVAAVEKIYAHESLTFNNTVSYEVISKWKAGLKDDMDARSNAVPISSSSKAIIAKKLNTHSSKVWYVQGFLGRGYNHIYISRTRSPSSVIGFKMPIDMLGLFDWLASKRQGMLKPVKVKCIFLGYLKGVVGNKALEEDHTFEVEPHGNVDHVVGSQEVQNQDLIYYHLARDREQHSTRELFNYKEDNNEVAFAVAEAKKIYTHESLTFNNTVACEVISKWKAGLKDDMDARSDVYVLSDGCKKCSDDSDAEILAIKGLLDKAKGNVLEGHSILSLKGSLSGDCDVEKNGKWSCIYAIGSQEYQEVCTRLDIALADVAMMLHMMALSPTKAGYMTLTEAAKEAIGLKGLAIESGFELKIVAGIATVALSKAIPGLRFQHRLKLLRIEDY